MGSSSLHLRFPKWQRRKVSWACGHIARPGTLEIDMERQIIRANPVIYASLLRRCGNIKYLLGGKRVHACIIRSGLEQDTHLGNMLVHMYFKCGSLEDARLMFDKMPERDVILWTLMISTYAQHGHCKEAFRLFCQMQFEGVMPDKITFLTILKACANPAALAEGKLIHAQVVESGSDIDITVGNAILNMYGKCGCLVAAQRMFDKLETRDVISWTAVIAAYIQYGHCKEALLLFRQMQLGSVLPNKITFATILSACASPAALAEGKLIHAHILESGLESDVMVGNTIVSMYGKCGSLEDARRMFDRMYPRNVISWTAMIAVYAQHGHSLEALRLFRQMLLEGLMPNKITFITVLNLCDSPAALAEGKLIHAHITERGFETDVTVGNAIVIMYGKCGNLKEAHRMFDKMHKRDVISWTVIIAAYAQHCHCGEAIQLFQQMLLEEVTPNKIAFITILNAFASPAVLADGKLIHAHIIDSGFEADVMVMTALIMMYGKCGSLEDACRVFNKMHQPDVASWNAMIATYAQNDHYNKALQLFLQLHLEGLVPNKITFITILNGCASLAALAGGKLIHACIVENGFETDLAVGNAVINMYGKCGSHEDAHRLFNAMRQRDVVTWTAMIAAYAQHGHYKEAIQLFWQMHLEGMIPNEITFLTILSACANAAALADGKLIHFHIIESGCESVVAIGSAIVSMYGKCGSLEDAYMMFNRMPQRDVVSWTSMIAAYAQNGHFNDAIQLFQQMQLEGMMPNKITFITILNACASVAALEEGKHIHAHVVDSGFESDIVVGNAIIDMYGKCGSMEDARRMFDKMHQRDVVSWTALISACAQHGHYKEAFDLVRQMQLEGIKPVSITFVSILSACSHAGLVDAGYYYLNSMSGDHGITPTMEHYGCMIDLLGRVGQLDEAEDFINKMPCQPDAVTWTTLLGACRIHGDVERGIRIAKHILEFNPQNVTADVLLSNIYAATGRWDDASKVRKPTVQWGVEDEKLERVKLNWSQE